MVNIFFGDSITAGYGVEINERWTNIYCADVGDIEDNYGISGTTMTPGIGRTPFNINDVPPFSNGVHRYIFIAYGTNDLDVGGSPSAYASATNNAITGILAKGWAADKIVLVWTWSWKFTEATQIMWRQALLSVAAQRGTRYLDFSYPIFSEPDPQIYAVDLLHPNILGNQRFAEIAVSGILLANINIVKGIKAISS